jgi:hypothetical protein
MGDMKHGFRATVKGTILDTKEPPTLSTISVDLPSIGCGVNGPTEVSSELVCSSGTGYHWVVTHGLCMLLGWGLLLPGGVFTAKFMKYKENALWFRIHKVVQPTGLMIT